MDIVLSKVFKDWEDGLALPEAESILRSMVLRFIERENPLALFHKHFLAQKFSYDENIKVDND